MDMLTYDELAPGERAEYTRLTTTPRGPADPRALMDPQLAAFLHHVAARHGHRGVDVRTFPDLRRHGTRTLLGMAMYDARVLQSPYRAERRRLRDMITWKKVLVFLAEGALYVDNHVDAEQHPEVQAALMQSEQAAMRAREKEERERRAASSRRPAPPPPGAPRGRPS